VEARVIDQDGIYDPCRPNDRLLLGMKGSISKFELGVLRARMLDAARAKTRRGELRLSVPFGYVWHREAGLGLTPTFVCGHFSPSRKGVARPCSGWWLTPRRPTSRIRIREP
jgi:hypothetical protein